MNAPWLFAEAYKYRRLYECFSISKHWFGYDVFYRQKASLSPHKPYLFTYIFILIYSQCDTFSRSADAVLELSMRFAEPFKLSSQPFAGEALDAERLMFMELTQGIWRSLVYYL